MTYRPVTPCDQGWQACHGELQDEAPADQGQINAGKPSAWREGGQRLAEDDEKYEHGALGEALDRESGRTS